MAKFEFIRLSLSPPPRTELDLGQEEPSTSRQEYLSGALRERQDFFRGATQYTYIPLDISDDCGRIAGYVGKPVSQKINATPEESYHPKIARHDRAALVLFDLRPDQQLAAFQSRSSVGSGDKIIEDLFKTYAKRITGTAWRVSAEFLFSPASFWEAATRHKGEITEVNFEFSPPNGLDGIEKMKQFDKAIRTETNSTASAYKIKNSSGHLYPTGEIIEETLRYASDGGGEVTMKAGRNIIFSSRRNKTSQQVHDSLMPDAESSLNISGLFDLLWNRIR